MFLHICIGRLTSCYQLLKVIALLYFVRGYTSLSNSNNKLLMISFDGFRWDYLNKSNNLTNFHRMISDGAWAIKGMKNSFLTKTFPNHNTLVTGLYEENHGVVGNEMYDIKFNQTFNIMNRSAVTDSFWWDNGGEPIWATNQRQSTEHRSGVFFWPGDRALVKGFLPYKGRLYDSSVPFKQRVDAVIDWFIDEYPINLGLLYFEEPDGFGHKYGPDSQEVITKIIEMDMLLGYIFDKLDDKKLMSSMNIIVTSDHGMTETHKETHRIDLYKFVNHESFFVTSTSPVACIFPKTEDLEDEIFKNLSNIPHAHVYHKADIPPEYHYTNNRRIPPIILEPEEHYWISYNDSVGPAGDHGYNNSLSSMHPIFLAMGPDFKMGSKVDSFNNVDVYPLLCKLLNLDPAPNNGTLEVVQALLVNGAEVPFFTFGVYIQILLFVGLISGLFGMAACQVHRQYKKRQRKVRVVTLSRHVGNNTYDAVPLMSGMSDDELYHVLLLYNYIVAIKGDTN